MQKAQRCFVSIALNEKGSKTDFPKLLDILLSNDYQTPKNAIKPLRGLFGGWTWWKGWMQHSENETSSSDYYKSASAEEEKVILVTSAKKEGIPILEDSHSKKYFEAIHNCLDGIVSDIDEASVGTLITSHLITIVNSLLYTHLVTVTPEEEISRGLTEIEALHLTSPIDGDSMTSEVLKGTHLMVLTKKNLLLLTPAPVCQSADAETPEECEENIEDEDSLEVDEKKEMEIIARIVQSLERFGSCSVEEVKEVSWIDCDSFVVKAIIPLHDIQLVNILVDENNNDSAGHSMQLIHIKYGSQGDVYLQVDYAIFVVNEIMNRIGSFLCLVCWSYVWLFTLIQSSSPNIVCTSYVSISS